MGRSMHRVRKERKKKLKVYMSRSQAMKKLSLTGTQFNELCVKKGIYPREPKKKKDVEGKNLRKTYYFRKDINSLWEDPVYLAGFQKEILKTKVKKFISKKDPVKVRSLRKKMPKMESSYLVIERYPNFRLALQDLNDPLTTLFLYSSLGCTRNLKPAFIENCRRLVVEFMHYVMHTRSLRKVFITTKGYYYQANIMGVDITWIVPHPFPMKTPENAENNILKGAGEFYVTLIKFVLFRLYKLKRLFYPPKVFITAKVKKFYDCRKRDALKNTIGQMYGCLNSLNIPIVSSDPHEKDEKAEEKYDDDLLEAALGEQTKEARKILSRVERQKKLFEGLKFFLSRECNKESLTFIIRCGGGEVSYDESIDVGSTYPEDDQSIKFQIVDRPVVNMKYINRQYVQPQWVYDSFNFGVLLPAEKYFVGSILPPHISPFESTYDEYIPPELKQLREYEKGNITDLTEATFEDLNEEVLPPVKPISETKVIHEKDCLKVVSGRTCLRDLNLVGKKEAKDKDKTDELMMSRTRKKLFNIIKRKEKQTEKRNIRRKKLRDVYEKTKLENK